MNTRVTLTAEQIEKLKNTKPTIKIIGSRRLFDYGFFLINTNKDFEVEPSHIIDILAKEQPSFLKGFAPCSLSYSFDMTNYKTLQNTSIRCQILV